MGSINEAGRETEHMVLPDDAKHVGLDEAHEHGYWGVTPDTTDRDEYTFDGAAKRLAKRTKNDQSPRSEGSAKHAGSKSGSGAKKD